MFTAEYLQGELERLFELDGMMTLSRELMGIAPTEVGSTATKGSFARALVQYCATQQGLPALADAIALQTGEPENVTGVFALEADRELREGEEVGGYQIVHQLGRGPLGAVYLAERPAPDNGHTEQVAIKLFDPSASRERGAVFRLLTAARAATQVRDRGLCNVLDAGTLSDGRAYVVSDYIDGTSLARRLLRGPLHFDELRGAAEALLGALDSLHRRGLVHGHIKPENVLLTYSERAFENMDEPFQTEGLGMAVHGVLTDVATIRLLEGASAPPPGLLQLSGAPSTMAPEVVRGQPRDARSDVYSLGCVIYHALTGRPVFEGETAIDVLAQHLHETPKPPSELAPDGWVPAVMDEVILRALAKTPADRFESALAFADALSGMTPSIFPPQPAEPVSEEALSEAIESLAQAPSDPQAALALETLVAPSGEWQKLVDGYAAVAATAEDPSAQRQLWLRIARVRAQELKDLAGAEAAYRKVLELDPSDAQAQDAIVDLYRRSGDHESVVGLLLDRLETEAGAEARGALLREIGTLYETKLDSEENARVAFAQALLEDPSEPRPLRALERLCTTQEHWTDAANTLASGIDTAQSPETAVALCMLCATIFERRLKSAEHALGVLNRALTRNPAHEPALSALTALYRDAGDFPELARVLLHRADSAKTPAQARDLRVEAGEVIWQQLADEPHARSLLTGVLDEDPTHERALQQLEEIYRKSRAYGPLADVLDRKANLRTGSEKARCLVELGELHEGRSLLEQAQAEFERALTEDGALLEAVDGLIRVHQAQKAHEPLLERLEQKLALCATPAQKTAALSQLAAVHEELGNVDEAIAAYQRITELSGAHEHACTQLARLYRSSSRFEELVEALDRHAKSVEDDAHKIELLLSQARVLMADLGAPERAAFVCERALALDPAHSEALTLTARMRTLSGDTASAALAIAALAESEGDRTKRAEHWVRAAELLERSEDLEGAVERYRFALEASPQHEPALLALKRLHEQRGDLQGKAEVLIRASELAQDPTERARRLTELARFQHEELQDSALANDAFRTALELDPQNAQAQLGVGSMALSRGDAAQAASLLEPLLARTSELPQTAALAACLGAGDALLALGKNDKAERAWLKAKALSSTHRGVLERLSRLAVAEGKHAEAATLLGDLLDRHGGNLEPKERENALLQLGLAYRAQGMHGKALTALGSASELAPNSVEPLRARFELLREKGDITQAKALLERLLSLTDDAPARFELLVQKGDLFVDADPELSAASYLSALELNGDDRNVLAKLMAVYSKGEDWSHLYDVLNRLALVVQDGDVAARYLTTAAAIAADELHDDVRAVECYERALAHAPTLDAAIQGLSGALTRQRSWERLAELKRSVLERRKASAAPDEVAQRWDELGELYEKRLKRRDEAVEAFASAHAAEPDNPGRRARLAEIYARHPSRYGAEAVALHLSLLAESPYKVDSYRALRKLYTRMQRPDEAWLLCQALEALNMAEPEEQTYYRRHRAEDAAAAQECLTDPLWQEHVLHPEQDALITQLFGLMQPAIAATKAQPLGAYGVRADQQLDCENEPAVMAQMLYYASGVSLIPLPPVFFRSQDPAGVSFLYTQPPSLGLGQGAFVSAPDQAMAFAAGHKLCFFRPGHLVRQLVPTGTGLRSWLLSAVRLINPRFPVPDAVSDQIERNRDALSSALPEAARGALESLVQRLLRDEAELDMRRWARGVDLTADRLGFVLSNSLETALAFVHATRDHGGFVSEQDRERELYLYSVSPQYIALRKALGIAIG